MLVVHELTLAINGKKLLDSINCSLLPGTITSFIGKSGAGKTTVLKSLINLNSNWSGIITLNGKTISDFSSQERAKKIGYVFQDFNLLPHLTVLENCINPLIVHGFSREQAYTKADFIVRTLEMREHLEKYPSELSGGQKQRIAIARALCLEPEVLLLDEPTASLDPHNRDILVAMLKKLASQGLTIGVSSQDMTFVNSIFERAYYLENGSVIEFCETKEKLSRCPKMKSWIL